MFGIFQNAAQAERTVDQLLAADFRKNTKAPERTATGVAAGGAIGGTLGLLAGDWRACDPGHWSIHCRRPDHGCAGRPRSRRRGGWFNRRVGLGIPEYEAKRYEGRLKVGGVLLSVHCDTSEEITRAKDVLKHNGAQDISSAGEASADIPATTAAR